MYLSVEPGQITTLCTASLQFCWECKWSKSAPQQRLFSFWRKVLMYQKQQYHQNAEVVGLVNCWSGCEEGRRRDYCTSSEPLEELRGGGEIPIFEPYALWINCRRGYWTRALWGMAGLNSLQIGDSFSLSCFCLSKCCFGALLGCGLLVKTISWLAWFSTRTCL